MKKEYLDVAFEIKKEDITDFGSFTGYGSTFGGKPDSYGDIVVEGAFKNSLKKNDVSLLWQHKSDMPIGVWNSIQEDNHGLKVQGQLALSTQSGSDAYELLKIGAIKGLSIGYRIPEGGYEYDKKKGIRYLKKVELHEISLVTFPANTNAQVGTIKSLVEADNPRELEAALRDAGLSKSSALYIVSQIKKGRRSSMENENEIKEDKRLDSILSSLKSANTDLDVFKKIHLEKKSVVPFKSYPLSSKTAEWNGPEETRKAEVEQLRMMSTWFDSENTDIKLSYKLPHHKASASFTTVWRGVTAAMAALLGARGGVRVPSADRRCIYNHLAKHYREFEVEPPEFRATDYTEYELKKIEEGVFNGYSRY